MLLDPMLVFVEKLTAKGLLLATAESCTGGLLAATLTAIPGASTWFDCALVTYSNEAKKGLLNISTEILDNHGAVSEVCAVSMLEGLWQKTNATIGVAITGIAGPCGGSEAKPVGSVYFAFGLRHAGTLSRYQIFPGTRDAIRKQAVSYAIQQLTQLIL